MKQRLGIFVCLLWLCSGVGWAQHAAGEDGHHHRHQHNHDFSDLDRWVEKFEDPGRAEWQKPDLVVQSLNLKPGQMVADIGAGTGYFTRRFGRAVSPGGLALAVEVESNFFPYIRKRAREEGQRNVLPVLAEVDDPRLEERSLDLIFLCDTLHHIENRPDYYQHLVRALKPGGRVVVVDFFKHKEIPVGPGPQMRLAGEAVASELRAAGFETELDTTTLPYQYILTATLPKPTTP